LNADVEVADPKVEQVVVGERLPRDLGLAADQGALLKPGESGPANRKC